VTACCTGCFVAFAGTLSLLESLGSIEFRYPDGRVVTGEYESYADRRLARGDRVQFDGSAWLLRDRVDRAGVTVYVFTPAQESDGPGVESRGRARGPGSAR
jgi:hypothetical protein